MDEKLTIAIILGTTREGNQSLHAARYVEGVGKTLPNVEILFVNPAELNLPHDGDNPDTRDARFSDVTARADAFFIVTPEYNHSYPGSLKRTLDSEFDNYMHKPVAVAGVSSGNWGGVRAVEALLSPLRHMGMTVAQTELYFPHVEELFDEQGMLKPEHAEQYDKSTRRMFEELTWLAKTLRWGRQNLKD